jgi:alpha-ketoglutarate-dependent taurine dioxygenase
MKIVNIASVEIESQLAPQLICAPELLETASLDDTIAWVSEQRGQFEQRLLQVGALLFRGFNGIKDAATFQTFASVFGSDFMTYVGGVSPRRKVQDQVFNSTDVPRWVPIELHQEMSYRRQFPDKLAFFCVTPPHTGGETPIADMRRVYQALPPELIDRFTQKGLRLRRRFPLKSGKIKLSNSWQVTFQTDSLEVVKQIVENQGGILIQTQSYLDIENEITPAWITHPITEEAIWFNQAHMLHKSIPYYWANGSRDWRHWAMALLTPIGSWIAFNHYVYGDGSEIAVADLNIIRRIVHEHQILWPWQQGDILLLENRIMAHGRKPFTGKRSILAALLKN